MTGKAEHFDVVIVGYGPVGATLGHLLGLCGVKTLILERDADPYPLPRAVHFDDEVMRTFQTIGLADEIAAKSRVNIGMKFVDAHGKLLLDWPRPQHIGPQGWHPSYRFHQPDLEAILRRAMATRDSVTVRTSCEVVTVDQNAACATVTYNAPMGEPRTVTAEHVVGCDGARSLVRRVIGTEVEDFGFRERWLVVDVLLKRDKPALGDYSIQFCNPARPATYVRGPENRRRWEISLHDTEAADEMMRAENVWRLLAPWLTPPEADIERAAVYTFHSTAVRTWRRDRLLLAGDAAHQTPPFMGQGMCAGIRDVANLAWKLALVVQERADDALLETYQSERLPNARAYIQTAVRLGGLINTAGTAAALRAAFPQPDGSSRMASIAPPLGPGLGVGPLAGRLFDQPEMVDGQAMDDAIGYRSALAVRADLVGGLAVPDGLVLVTTDQSPGLAASLDALSAEAVLMRPDRFIHAVATDSSGIKDLLKIAFPTPISS